MHTLTVFLGTSSEHRNSDRKKLSRSRYLASIAPCASLCLQNYYPLHTQIHPQEDTCSSEQTYHNWIWSPSTAHINKSPTRHTNNQSGKVPPSAKFPVLKIISEIYYLYIYTHIRIPPHAAFGQGFLSLYESAGPKMLQFRFWHRKDNLFYGRVPGGTFAALNN